VQFAILDGVPVVCVQQDELRAPVGVKLSV
jgi:hypothetical protein